MKMNYCGLTPIVSTRSILLIVPPSAGLSASLALTRGELRWVD